MERLSFLSMERLSFFCQLLLRTGGRCHGMNDVSGYTNRPVAFTFRFVRRRWLAHAAVVAAGLGGGGCYFTTQFGIKVVGETLAKQAVGANHVWSVFGLLVVLIAADNLMWRIGSWVA